MPAVSHTHRFTFQHGMAARSGGSAGACMHVHATIRHQPRASMPCGSSWEVQHGRAASTLLAHPHSCLHTSAAIAARACLPAAARTPCRCCGRNTREPFPALRAAVSRPLQAPSPRPPPLAFRAPAHVLALGLPPPVPAGNPLRASSAAAASTGGAGARGTGTALQSGRVPCGVHVGRTPPGFGAGGAAAAGSVGQV